MTLRSALYVTALCALVSPAMAEGSSTDSGTTKAKETAPATEAGKHPNAQNTTGSAVGSPGQVGKPGGAMSGTPDSKK